MEKKKEHKSSGSVVVKITVDIIGKDINIGVAAAAERGADKRAIEIGREIAKMNSAIIGHFKTLKGCCAKRAAQPEKKGGEA